MRFDLPVKKTLVHTMIIPIRWGDLDAMGHVNSTVYFRYFESVRIDWMHGLGGAPNPDGEGPVIVNAFCTFAKQLEFPGHVVAQHFVANPGRTSIETYFTLAREEDPATLCTTGGARMVWVDSRTSKAVPLPAWLRASAGA